MRFSHHRTLTVFMTASVLALAAGSTAAAAAPAAPAAPSKKVTRCTVNQTFKYTLNTKPRTFTVKNNGTNIRTFPGTDCKIVTVVKKGTKLAGTGRNAQLIPRSSSKWSQVRLNGALVWVANTQFS